jgi:GGDEF domain-containing protein
LRRLADHDPLTRLPLLDPATAGDACLVEVAREACPLSASIGVAVYPQHGDTPDALRRKADAATCREAWRWTTRTG